MSDQVKQIAMRIQDLREISGYTVEQVAEHTGVTAEEYATYESGAVDIPISFLLELSNFFNVDTTTILTGESPRMSVYSVTRQNMGVDIQRRHHYTYKNLAYNFNHRKIEPLLVTVSPEANPIMETNSHPGQEFDYVLEGTLRLKIGDQEMVLGPGDSVYYDSNYPHAMQAADDQPCRFLAMVIPY